MIRYAQGSDTKAIRYLWDIAFGEDIAFNDYFFENIFIPEYTLIIEEAGCILSMAQTLPYRLRGVGDITYIYGAATDPAFRGQGLMRRLLEYSFEKDKAKGAAASALIPAEKGLFDYYKKIGYETQFYINKYTYIPNKAFGIIKKASKEDIPRLMEIYRGDVERSHKYWDKQLNMLDSLGGDIYIYNNAYALVSKEADEVFGNESDKKILLNSLCQRLKRESIRVTEKGGDYPFGMIKKHRAFKSGNLYMNLMYN